MDERFSSIKRLVRMKIWSPKITIALISISTLLLGSTAFAGGSSPSKPKADAQPAEKQAIKIYNKGIDELRRSDYKAAASKFRLAIQKNGDFAEAHNNLAFALRKQGSQEFDTALEHYQTAVDLQPEMAEARMYRGVLYLALDKTSLAEKDLEWLEANSPSLAKELQWVFVNGREKEPPHLFGVSEKM